MRMPDELTLESRVSGARPTYEFHTADGVCSKRSFRAAELLLVESLWGTDHGHVLQVEANYGVVGTVLAGSARSVHMVESSARAARLCEHNAARNGVDAAVSLLADISSVDRPVDVVAYAPKPYTPVALGKQRLADALALLPPGGEFVLAASEQIGLARYERCLEEVTSAPVEHVAERDGCHLLSAIRPPSVSAPTYVEPSVLRPTVDGVTLSLVTVPGLFASSQLDDGTRLLLETATIDDGDRVLDLCCGYGAIGAYAGAVADCEVWLSDDDRVATRCAECSLRRSGVEGRVTTADCIEGTRGETFDRVLCNPPTHAGDDVLTELFEGIEELLAVGGRALLVHHRSLDLDAELSVFDEVQMIRMGPEHVVIEAVPDTGN